jgi:hypothetical protein
LIPEVQLSLPPADQSCGAFAARRSYYSLGLASRCVHTALLVFSIAFVCNVVVAVLLVSAKTTTSSSGVLAWCMIAMVHGFFLSSLFGRIRDSEFHWLAEMGPCGCCNNGPDAEQQNSASTHSTLDIGGFNCWYCWFLSWTSNRGNHGGGGGGGGGTLDSCAGIIIGILFFAAALTFFVFAGWSYLCLFVFLAEFARRLFRGHAYANVQHDVSRRMAAVFTFLIAAPSAYVSFTALAPALLELHGTAIYTSCALNILSFVVALAPYVIVCFRGIASEEDYLAYGKRGDADGYQNLAQ